MAVLHPTDYETLELTKTVSTGGGQYIIGDPGSPDGLWRMAVVSSAAMTQGQFVVFDATRGAVLYDRQQAAVEISREHESFFVKNLCAILAEERIALVVPDSLAVVAGSFPVS